MKLLIRSGKFFLILLLMTSCKSLIKEDSKIIEPSNKSLESNIEEKQRIEIRVSCGEGDVSKFLKEGWVIVKEFTEEKVCTWKSFPANKSCNMEKDKGCKITEPDEIGKETIYLLEK